MGRNTQPITVKVMQKILESQGAVRVSKKAAEVLAEYISDRADEISKKAVELSLHAKRTTVLEDDVRLAAKR